MIAAVEAYDASEVDERPRSAYLSRKDVRVLMIVGFLLVLLMMPIYMVFKAQRDRHLCKQNVGQIFKAIQLYAINNDNRFPPLYVEGPNREPNLFQGNDPFTWMSLVQSGMSARSSFVCPSADEAEMIENLHPDADKPPFQSAYGMYRPWSGYNSPMIVNPDTSVLIVETANNGAANTFDPAPFSHGIDGLVVGWNDDNFQATNVSEYVTRLAFPESKGGKFLNKGPARHGDIIHAVTTSGRLLYLKPPAARIERLSSKVGGSEIIGRWADR